MKVARCFETSEGTLQTARCCHRLLPDIQLCAVMFVTFPNPVKAGNRKSRARPGSLNTAPFRRTYDVIAVGGTTSNVESNLDVCREMSAALAVRLVSGDSAQSEVSIRQELQTVA